MTQKFSDAHRYARQLVLAEVGPEGQAKLNALKLNVPPGRSGAVAAEYLRRAGVTIENGSNSIPLFEAATNDETRIALDTLHGTLAALEALRRGLGMTPAEPLGILDAPE